MVDQKHITQSVHASNWDPMSKLQTCLFDGAVWRTPWHVVSAVGRKQQNLQSIPDCTWWVLLQPYHFLWALFSPSSISFLPTALLSFFYLVLSLIAAGGEMAQSGSKLLGRSDIPRASSWWQRLGAAAVERWGGADLTGVVGWRRRAPRGELRAQRVNALSGPRPRRRRGTG